MSDFKAFMVGKATDEVVEYVASKRMGEPVLNKKGEPTGEVIPEPWKIKPIDNKTDEAIRKECTKKVPIAGKRGQYNQETDTDKYMGKVCAACIVHPNLNNAELQDYYGVKTAEDLLKEMLLPAEYTELKAKVMEVNGYDMSMEDLVDEAKN